MFNFSRLCLGLLARSLRSRRRLLFENLALRQQLTVLKRNHPKPRLRAVDKLFWGLARYFWSAWKQSLIVVSPETVVRWHRTGFRMYWSMISKVRKQVGGKKLSREVRELIFRMVAENPTWGAPRIHGELLMLGVDVSERTISCRITSREAFPFATAPRFLIHDRDAKYGTEVPAAIRSLKINAVRTSFESPRQNGVAERWLPQ
jgi:hypothetical protein